MVSMGTALAQATNPSPVTSNDFGGPISLLTSGELSLSLAVLIFGVIVLFIEYRLLASLAKSVEEVLRTLVVTLIVLLSLAMVSFNLGDKTVSSVIGLFGTIVGYLQTAVIAAPRLGWA
jgi:hypothetical protein